jgi:hypothetical protein
MNNNKSVKYIAKPHTWFDAGTEVTLIEDMRLARLHPVNSGIFEGYRNRKFCQEICSFEEFEVIEK